MSTTTMNQVKSNILVKKVFVPKGGKCQFAIKVFNFDGKITNFYVVVVFVCLPLQTSRVQSFTCQIRTAL